MKNKDEALSMFNQYNIEVKTQSWKKLMYLRLDNWGEYKSLAFVEFYR